MLLIVLPIIAVLLIIIVLLFQNPNPRAQSAVSYTQYLAIQSHVRSATIHGDEVSGRDDPGKPFTAIVPSGSTEATHLAERGVDVTLVPATTDSTVAGYVVVALNGIWLLATLWYFHRIARAVDQLAGRRP